MSIWQEPMPAKPTNNGQSVSPMTKPHDPPHGPPDGPGSVHHVPIPAPARVRGEKR